jgi:hypothetical protein
VDSPPVSSAGGLVIIVLVAAAKASADADAVERCMHAYAPFGCLCVGSVRSVFQIPWPPCSFFYRTATSATPSTRILHRIRHSVLLGPVLRARRRSLHVCCSSLHQQQKKAEKGKARRIPRPVVFASPISRPEHTTRQRITARTLMSFFAVCSHSTAQALIYLWSGDRLLSTTPSYTAILLLQCAAYREDLVLYHRMFRYSQHTCLSRCTRTANISEYLAPTFTCCCLRW